MLTTFCLLSMVNTLTKPATIDPILINMAEVSAIKPRLKTTDPANKSGPSLVLMDGKQFVVKESVQQIYDKCVK